MATLLKATGELTDELIEALRAAGATVTRSAIFDGYWIEGISTAAAEKILGYINLPAQSE